jgi:acyl-CoA reductase-like NAD-dependent aldehyde dehydrogenase
MFLIATFVLLVSLLYLFRNKPLKRITVAFPPEVRQNWSSHINSDHSIKDGQMIKCYDPATGYSLGSVLPKSPKEMKEIVARSRNAQRSFQHSSFDLRKKVLGSLLNWIVENQEMISRMSARDSGKTCKILF